MSGTILCLPAAGTLYAAKDCFVLSTHMARFIRGLLGKSQP